MSGERLHTNAINVVQFDLDDTMVLTHGALKGAHNKLHHEHGIEPRSDEEIEKMLGRRPGEVLTTFYGYDSLELRKRYGELVLEHSHLVEPVPCAADVVHEMREDGLRIALNTSRIIGIEEMLKVSGLSMSDFDAIATGSSPGQGKPHRDSVDIIAKKTGYPTRNHALVGDKRKDMDTIRAKGVDGFGIGVSHKIRRPVPGAHITVYGLDLIPKIIQANNSDYPTRPIKPHTIIDLKPRP